MILAHFAQIADPSDLPEQFRKLLQFAYAHKFRESFVHSCGKGSLAAFTERLLKQLLIKHKICAPHVYSLSLDD